MDLEQDEICASLHFRQITLHFQKLQGETSSHQTASSGTQSISAVRICGGPFRPPGTRMIGEAIPGLDMDQRHSLNGDEIEHVRSSFDQIWGIAPRTADLFYDRLFEIAPQVRSLFRGDASEQKRKLD